MGYFLLLAVVGLSLFGAVYILARLRAEKDRYAEKLPETVVQVNLLDNDDAVVVAEGRGKLVFANPKARTWFGMNGGEPDLELMAEIVQPSDTFLELFSKEGQASFRIANRRVEATSHYVPRPDATQIVVIMRELATARTSPEMLDPLEAMNALSEIGQIVSGKPRLDDMLDSILGVIHAVIPFDVGEVTLWDEDLQVMRSRGRYGENSYFERFDSTDGVYHVDDSFSGWIARYHQPLLVADTALRPDVRPKLTDYPFKSYVGVPLHVGEKFIGALELGSRTRVAFDHEDMSLLRTIAGQIGIAIENARLYESQSERVAELSGLQQLMSALNAINDRRQMFSLLSSRISALMNVEMCGILLLHEEQGALVGQLPFQGVPDSIASMYRIPISSDSPAFNIFQNRETWFSNNVRADDLVRQVGLLGLAEAVGVRTTAFARMSIGDRHFGVVQVANKRDTSGFSESDLRLLSVFASQVAVVVDNARLFDLERRRTEELSGLYEISASVGRITSLGTLYAQITARIAKLMDVQMCGILLHDTESSELISQPPFYGVDDDLIRHYRIPLTPGTAFWDLYQADQPWISNELRTDPILRESSLDKLAMLIGVRQTMIVPLMISGRRLGVVQISNRLQGGEFTENDARVLSIFAAQAATLLENARLELGMTRRVEESESLRRIAQVIVSENTVDRVIGGVINEIIRSVNADIGAVALLDQATGALTIKPEWTSGMADLNIPFTIDTFAPGFQNSTVFTGRSFFSNNLRNDPRILPIYKGFAERYGFNAAVQVPLVVQQRNVGEMTIGSRRENAFTEDDLSLLEAIATQLSSVLGRDEISQDMDDDLRVRIRELDALTRISNEINRTTELDRILDVIRTETQRTLYAENVSIVLIRRVSEGESEGYAIERRIGNMPINAGLAPIERVAVEQGSLTIVNNYAESSLTPEPPQAHNAISAPVFYGEQIVGVIHVINTDLPAYTLQQQDFARTMANQVSVAYGNDARYREQLERAELLKQRTEQLNQIFELGRMIRSGEPLEAVLEAVAYGVRETVGFNVVLISIVDNEQKITRRIAQAGLPLSTWEQARKVTPPLSNLERIFLPRFQLSASYFVPGEASDTLAGLPTVPNPNPPPRGGTGRWLYEDLLIVPLRNPFGELIGIMSVDDPRDGQRPGMRVIQALETLGTQAAYAIENFRLVQAFQREADAARREADRLEQLYIVANESQRPADLTTRLKVIAEGIQTAGWNKVAITLRDQNLEPTDTITSGYTEEDASQLKANLLSGMVWSQRIADPELRRFRIGQGYYLRHSDPWMTEKKLIAGMIDPTVGSPESPVQSNDWHPLDTVYLPLYGVDRSRIIGIITMDAPADGKAPTEAGLRPIELFASQAAAIIENTRLYQGLTAAAQQEQRINEVTETISSTLDLYDIIQGVADGLQQMLPFTRMTVGLRPEGQEHFDILNVTIGTRGNIVIKEGVPIPVENTAMGAAVAQSSSRVYHSESLERANAQIDGETGEISTEPSPEADFEDLLRWRSEGERTSLVVPMIAGGRIVGAMHMGSELARAFGFETQLSLIARIANLTAVAIENAQLFQQTIDREKFSTALSRVASAMNARVELTEVLRTVVDESNAILGASGAYLWNLEGNDIVGMAGNGVNAERIAGARIRIDEHDPLIREVIGQRRPVFVGAEDVPQWRSALITKALGEISPKAVLAIPLLREDQPSGTLIYVQTDQERRFTDADIEQVSAFAVQAGIAIESARLNQETRELQSFNESVIQSIQQGIIVLDKQMRIRTVNSFMQQVYLWGDDAYGQHLFDYRPNYREFLEELIENVLVTGNPETKYGIRERGDDGRTVVRNFYVYPLLQTGQVEGLVILVEDVTTRTVLEADIAARAQQLSVLTEISSQLTALLQPEAVVKLMFDELEHILEYDRATLWLRREDKLVISAARGYPNTETLIGIEAEIADSELFRELATRGQVLNIPDITHDRRFPSTSAEQSIRSWLGVSLVSRGNLAGLLVLEKNQVAYYSDTMEQLALNFANQCAVALENASLFQETNRAAEENTLLYREAANRARELDQQTKRLSLLYRVSNALTQSIDLEDVFEVALRETLQMLGTDKGKGFILDRQMARIVMEYPRGNEPPSKELLSMHDSEIVDEIRRTLRPVVMRDALNNPLATTDPLMKHERVLSSITVPLSVSGQMIGFVKFDATSDYRDFTAEQIETAQTIASQAAIAVQNASLLEQSLARTRELETLFEATQSISATLELDTVIQNIAMQMTVALGADGCEISTWNTYENTLEIATDLALDGDPDAITPKGTKLLLNNYPIRRRALETRQTIMIRAGDPTLDEAEKEALLRRKVASRILLPMMVRDQAIGLIEVEIRDPHRVFTATEVRLARTLSSQAAVAIENAGLQTETASKLGELFTLNEFSTALAAAIDQDGIIALVRRQLPTLVKAQNLILALVDENTVTYPLALRDNQAIQIDSHPLGDDEITFVVHQTMPQRLVGAEYAGVLKNQGMTPRLLQARCLVGVPLLSAGKTIGALIAADENNDFAFTLDDQRVLSTVGAQIAVALENARLFARTRQFATELEGAVLQRTEELQRERDSIDFLYRLTSSLTSSLDINLTLNRSLEMMVEALDAEMGVILSIDSISENLTFRATHNLSEEIGQEAGVSTRQGLAGWMIQSHQSAVVPDVQQDYRWLQLGTWENPPRSAIGALLEANEDTLGVVMLYHTQPDRFTEAQLRLLEAASTQIASAMNNADLYALIREQAERLAAMVRREQVDSTKTLAIVDSIADGVMVASREGEITQFNSAAERILGLPRRQVISKHISTLSGLYGAAGGQNWVEVIEKWTKSPTEHRSGEEVRTQIALDNGKFIAVTLSPVTMGDQFLGTVTVFRDITREIEVDRMKSEFVATVSHELRTPMTSIKGYADLLLLGAAGKVTEQQQRFLTTIKTNADRLSLLVNELLDISRIDRGVVKLNIQPTDLEEVMDMSLQQIRERIRTENKPVEVESDIPGNLPLLRADPDKILQVINHLMNNAYSYTPAGGQIRVKAVPEAQTVLITIADTGVGISPEKQERIWERFYRDEEQPLVMETSGAGLGLSIVKEYVDMHSGQVWLESEVGKGTTFYVRIPAFISEN